MGVSLAPTPQQGFSHPYDLFRGGDHRGVIQWGMIAGKRRKVKTRRFQSLIHPHSGMDAATFLEALKSPPGNRLEALKGDLACKHSIRINDQYRICFGWLDNGADKVEITDYH